RIRDAEHDRVSDRSYMRTAPRRELFTDSVKELGDQVRGLLVAVSLGQCGVAGDVGEQERGARRVRRPCGRPALTIVKLRHLSSVPGGSGVACSRAIRLPQAREPAAMRVGSPGDASSFWVRRNLLGSTQSLGS